MRACVIKGKFEIRDFLELIKLPINFFAKDTWLIKKSFLEIYQVTIVIKSLNTVLYCMMTFFYGNMRI